MENLIESDEFCSLPHSAQALYFHLNMSADDDGFVGNPVRIIKSLSIPKKNIEILVTTGFIIPFDSGVVVITHWLSNNNIKKDRYTPTRFKQEFSELEIKDGAMYIKASSAICGDVTEQRDSENAPEVSIGKVSKFECSVAESRQAEDRQGESRKAEGREGEPSEDKKREEKDSLVSLSEIEREKEIKEKEPSAEGSMENDKSFSVSLSEKDENDKKTLYKDRFIASIKLHVMTKYGTLDDKGFIDYYEKRGWLDENHQPIVMTYKKYVAEWMKKHSDEKDKSSSKA